MVLLLIIVTLLVLAIIILIARVRNKGNGCDGFEKKYGVKIIDESHPCINCAYFYDGTVNFDPFVYDEDRPHPPCCTNIRRCLEDKTKCFHLDTL